MKFFYLFKIFLFLFTLFISSISLSVEPVNDTIKKLVDADFKLTHVTSNGTNAATTLVFERSSDKKIVLCNFYSGGGSWPARVNCFHLTDK